MAHPRLVTAPAHPVASLVEIKRALKIEGSDFDPLLEEYERGAVAHLDGWSGVLGRAIRPQAWGETFPGWGRLRLALPDVTAVAVEGIDAAGDPVAAETVSHARCGAGWCVTADGPPVVRVEVVYQVAMPEALLPAARDLVLAMVQARHDGIDHADMIARMIAPLRWAP